MYSQNNEDDLILEYFGCRVGRFCDIGAHDGATFSNTLALIERGWSGVMVEPSPSPFVSMMHKHGQNSRITLVHAAISNHSEWRPFHASDNDPEHGNMVGTLSEPHSLKWADVAEYQKFMVRTVGVRELLEFGKSYDFISIDTEGNSADLFFAMIEAGAAATCWCVEHDDRTEEILQRAESVGLKQLAWNQENMILVRS